MSKLKNKEFPLIKKKQLIELNWNPVICKQFCQVFIFLRWNEKNKDTQIFQKAKIQILKLWALYELLYKHI